MKPEHGFSRAPKEEPEIPVLPFIPLIAAGVGGALGLVGAHKQASAAKAQQATISPLIAQQTETSKWALDQAKTDIPAARSALSGPLAFWNKILSGDRNAGMSAIGPSADLQAGQTAAANRNQSEFAPRGGRRTLMLGDQPLSTVTSENQSLLNLRTGSADKVTGIGQILAQLGLGETSAATGAGASAIQGAIGAGNLQNQSSAQGADAYKGVGASIGQALLAIQAILKNKTGGSIGGGSGGSDAGGGAPATWPTWASFAPGIDPTQGR